MRRIVVLCGLHARGTVGVLMEEGGSDAVVVCADDAEVWMDRSPPPDLWSPQVDMDHLKSISEDCLMEGACIVWVHSKRSAVATYIAALFAALLPGIAAAAGPSV